VGGSDGGNQSLKAGWDELAVVKALGIIYGFRHDREMLQNISWS
jgi:hypothetical protein